MTTDNDGLRLLQRVLESYDQKFVAEYLNEVSPGSWNREMINRWVGAKASPKLSHAEYVHLERLLPQPPATHPHYDFDFIDLFAGIGGIRTGFEKAGGRCVFTSEWNPYAVRTYKANHYSDPEHHVFNEDIRRVTLSDQPEVTEPEAYDYIRKMVPKHDVLLAGFPPVQ